MYPFMEFGTSKYIAEIAQLVEQRIRNAWVEGSSPFFGCLRKAINHLWFLAFYYIVIRDEENKWLLNGICI